MGQTVALWVAAALTAYSITEQQSASKKASAAESRRVGLMQEAEGQRAKEAQLKASREQAYAESESRKRRASLQAGREQAGAGAVGGTAIGGEYSLASRSASGMGFFGQQVQIGENIFALGQQASQASQEAVQYKQDASTAGAWGKVAGSVFDAAGGYKELWASGKKVFS